MYANKSQNVFEGIHTLFMVELITNSDMFYNTFNICRHHMLISHKFSFDPFCLKRSTPQKAQ